MYFAHMALSSVRHVPVFVTVAGPIIAAELSVMVESVDGRRAKIVASRASSTRWRRIRSADSGGRAPGR